MPDDLKLLPLDPNEIEARSIKRLAEAVLAQSILVVAGLKWDRVCLDRVKELRFWEAVQEDNLWIEALGVRDLEALKRKVINVDGAELEEALKSYGGLT